MSIEYDFYKTNGAFAKKQPYHVRVVESDTVNSDDLARNIQYGTTLSIPDIKGALSALSNEIATQLKSGRRVHIEGLGYLSLSISGDIVTDKNDQLRLKNPSVRTVRFLPEEQLMHKFDNLSFSCQQHRGNKSDLLDDVALDNVISALMKKRPFFTPREFFSAAHLTRSNGYRTLRMLETRHLIKNVGTPVRKLYSRTSNTII